MTVSLVLAVAVVVAVGVVALALTASLGLRRVGSTLIHLAVAFSPLLAVRVSANLIFADVFLLAGIGVLVLDALIGQRRLAVRPLARLATVFLLLFIGGLVGVLVENGPIGPLSKFAGAVVPVLVAGVLLRPNRRQVRSLACMFVIGSSASVIAGLTVEPLFVNRVVGWSLHPNHLGLACVFAATFSLGFYLSATTRTGQRWALAGLAITLVGVLSSGSRASLLGVGFAFLAVALTTKHVRLVKLTGAGALIVLLGLTTGVVNIGADNAFTRAIGESASTAGSDAERGAYRAGSVAAIEKRPVFGDGFANPRRGHSLPLQLWESSGILGLVAFALLGFSAHHTLRKARGDVFAVALCSATIGFFWSSFAFNALWDRYLWFAFILGPFALATRNVRSLRATAIR